MITADNLLLIMNAVRWPVVVFLLVIVFLILFKSEISEVLKRIQKAKYPGGEFVFFGYGQAPIDTPIPQQALGPEAESVVQPEQPEGKLIKWGNSGNLFWLGYDLTWTIDTLLRGGPRDRIFHGLRQSLHHLRSLGLGDTPVEVRLARLKAEAQDSLEKDWTPLRRSEYTNELSSLIRAIGDLAEANQPDFQPSPKE